MKEEYPTWMHPESLRTANYYDDKQQWHQRVRTAHRAFLFQIVGNYELVIFFLYVPFKMQHLSTYYWNWNTYWNWKTNIHPLHSSVQYLREMRGGKHCCAVWLSHVHPCWTVIQDNYLALFPLNWHILFGVKWIAACSAEQHPKQSNDPLRAEPSGLLSS